MKINFDASELEEWRGGKKNDGDAVKSEEKEGSAAVSEEEAKE
jgi:hypothetical protein